VAIADQNRAHCRVLEVDQHGNVRWQIDDVNYPLDARILPGNRVLISEYGSQRITERDFRGNILWQKTDLPAKPMNVQRLPSGNTFVCTEAGLMEFDVAGKTVLDIKIDLLTGACKTPDGQMICVTSNGRGIRLDSAGKEVKSFVSDTDKHCSSVIDLTPTGRVLVSKYQQHEVVEFDLQGQTLWHTKSSGRTNGSVVRNGHVMAAHYYENNVEELDRAGRVVWRYETPAGYTPFLARKR
jgi:outer membrane protein assembly factor BamB